MRCSRRGTPRPSLRSSASATTVLAFELVLQLGPLELPTGPILHVLFMVTKHQQKDESRNRQAEDNGQCEAQPGPIWVPPSVIMLPGVRHRIPST